MRGVYVACAILLLIALVSIANLALSYDGQCGGFFPGLSGRKPCSFLQYVSGDAVAIAMVLAVTFWPLLLALLIVPPFVGYLFDRRAKRNTDAEQNRHSR
jgi:hypothetical protein